MPKKSLSEIPGIIHRSITKAQSWEPRPGEGEIVKHPKWKGNDALFDFFAGKEPRELSLTLPKDVAEGLSENNLLTPEGLEALEEGSGDLVEFDASSHFTEELLSELREYFESRPKPQWI